MRDGIKEKDIKDFVKYASKLDEVIKRIQEYNPNGHIYVNEDVFCLRGIMTIEIILKKFGLEGQTVAVKDKTP